MESGATVGYGGLDVLRVLLLEDDAAAAAHIEAHLGVSGLRIDLRCMHSEFAFRRCVEEFHPHLILSEFTLSGFDGCAALRIARQLAPAVPFIFVSDDARAAQMLGCGATDLVRKANIAHLMPALERALREKTVAGGNRAAESRLNESRQRLRDIMDATQEWIWELDAQGAFTFSNRCVEDLLGYPLDAILGRKRFDFVHPDDEAAVRAQWAQIDAQGAPTTGLVARWVHRDGSFRWLDCNVVMTRDAAGQGVCYRGADRDITVRRRQDEQIARLTRVNELLSRINSVILRVDDRPGVLHEACRLAVEQGGYQFAVVFMIEPGSVSVSPSAWWGVDDDQIVTRQVSFGNGEETGDDEFIAKAMRAGKPVVCNNLGGPASITALPQEWTRYGIQAVAVLPLFIDGTSVGVLTFHSQDPAAFNAEEIRSLERVSGEVSFALQYLRHEDLLQHLSYFDALTGLANRQLWCERLARRMRSYELAHHEINVVVFDIDGLSAINDACGRHTGDQLLQRIAERLRAIEGGPESVTYLGAAVFAAFFEGPARGGGVPGFARARIESLLDEPLTIGGQDIKVAVRLGASCFPGHGDDAHSLLENAEVALRRAKHHGEAYVRYSTHMTTEAAQRLVLEGQLRQSVRDEAFELYYQPIFSARTGRISAVEALLRWRHPQQGIVSAGQIVPVLESLGLIEEVGAWALRRAARDRAAWIEQGLPNIRVAVNVSAAQLRRSNFVEIVMSAVGKLRPQQVWLDLEVTESMLMHDVEASMQKLNQLRTHGVQFAIDDFGTGYSSLSRLASLPINTLKIDRSFVHGVLDEPRSIAIVETILSLARSLDMNTIAEGIETEQQRALLSTMGCDELQGFLLSHPLSAADCAALMLLRRRLEDADSRAGDGIDAQIPTARNRGRARLVP
ncbi:MAG: EAL domain-containing protein [Steroidobacteraceae bacterium]|jgi:diguanylate cyclase (GGDEF)-like protein/PAS domain S-box-containing protein